MKATQVRAKPVRNEKGIVCDVCGKHMLYPYGTTRQGNGGVCSRACQEKYDEMLKVRFGPRIV